MSTAPAWTRGEQPLAVRVAAGTLLGVALGATGALRAAHDLPIALALVTMGAAVLVHTLMSLGGPDRLRRGPGSRGSA